jgi:hypothetical protein
MKTIQPIDPTRAMAGSLGVVIDWRPFTLDIPSYLGSAKLDEKGKVVKCARTPQQWSGVKYAYMDARRYANLTGKALRGTWLPVRVPPLQMPSAATPMLRASRPGPWIVGPQAPRPSPRSSASAVSRVRLSI